MRASRPLRRYVSRRSLPIRVSADRLVAPRHRRKFASGSEKDDLRGVAAGGDEDENRGVGSPSSPCSPADGTLSTGCVVIISAARRRANTDGDVGSVREIGGGRSPLQSAADAEASGMPRQPNDSPPK